MLSPEQMQTVVDCIEEGGKVEFDFGDASLCDAFDEIIDHLESKRIEDSLFGTLVETHEGEAQEYDSPEDEQRAFVHHVMHWAFQLGVGAALAAVAQDLKGTTED